MGQERLDVLAVQESLLPRTARVPTRHAWEAVMRTSDGSNRCNGGSAILFREVLKHELVSEVIERAMN